MSQGLSPIASGGDGATVRSRLNAALQRLQTKASGTSRPSDIAAGESWIETDNPGGGLWALWLYDGTSDCLDAIIDSTSHAIYRVTGQVVSVTTTGVATGTTQIPYDDTIPQNTEGDQYMSLAVTPLRSTSKLEIDVVANVSHSSASAVGEIMALFQDSTANALAAVATIVSVSGADQPGQLVINHNMASGTTSATTFKTRIGSPTAGTTTFNGAGGNRRFGGVSSSTMRIRETLQ